MPYFSIIVPVYKAESDLRQCVDSILSQSFADLELILVDDGSPDGSGALCDAYAAADRRVRALHQSNAGPTPARRRGLALAQGEYICFADADDWVVPHWLETVKDLIDQNGRPDMVLYDFFQPGRDPKDDVPDLRLPAGFYDKARLEKEVYPYMLCDLRRQRGDLWRSSFGSRQLFGGYLWSKAFRRELVRAHFVSDDRITVFEDVAMAYECVYHAGSVCVTDERLYAYQYRPGSNLRHYRPGYLAEIDALYDYLSARLGRLDPALAVQINVSCARRFINCIAGELEEHGRRIRPAAEAFQAAVKQTGLDRKLSFRGMNLPLAAFLLLIKLHLYAPAALLVRAMMR